MRMYENETMLNIPAEPAPIDERIDKIINDFENEQNERERLRPTIVPTAKRYRKALNVSGTIACLSTIVMLVLMILAVTTHKEFNPQAAIIALGIVMIISLTTFILFAIKRHRWVRRLEKVGLSLPLKYY